MIISDPVYGKTEINEPIILELIKTATIQRLKGFPNPVSLINIINIKISAVLNIASE